MHTMQPAQQTRSRSLYLSRPGLLLAVTIRKTVPVAFKKAERARFWHIKQNKTLVTYVYGDA